MQKKFCSENEAKNLKTTSSSDEITIYPQDIDYCDKKNKMPPKKEGHIRILHISDTHMLHEQMQLPECDVVIHSGDFCLGYGTYYETKKFAEWFEKQTQCKHKVIIAGNHEFPFDLNTENEERRKKMLSKEKEHDPSIPYEEIKKVITQNPKFTYQEDTGIELFGYYIYGSPWSQISSLSGFQVPQEKMAEIFSEIPKKTDIQVCHTPPYKICDYVPESHFGCRALVKEIFNRIKPKFTLFGHIHYSNGFKKYEDMYFINSAVADEEYEATGKMHFFDLPILG